MENFDAVVVGSGPNGLAAAISMQQAGLSVLVIEGKETVGGGMRTAELTLPGFKHDICSAVHPLAVGSPFFSKLPLADFGLTFIQPPIAAAHPFHDGTAALLTRSFHETAELLGPDATQYQHLLGSLVENWHQLVGDILSPLKIPAYPLQMAAFGLKALQSAGSISKKFKTEKARGLWGGVAAHAMQPLSNLSTAAIGMVLCATAHVQGWPVPRGGSQAIANAMLAYFLHLGGKIEYNSMITALREIPPCKAVLLDVSPKHLASIAGEKLSGSYLRQLHKFRYGMGVFKIDWALQEPIPFSAAGCRKAGTVHLGNTFNEIAKAEAATAKGKHPDRPFVILAQPSLFDEERAPAGKHTAWAYCHVPGGSQVDMTIAIEEQVERFAPGFKDCILARSVMNSAAMEAYNPNYVGGDINGGVQNLRQLYTRPTLSLRPYRTSAKGIYLCSASTPPGGGVHGMCGYHAAKLALADVFNIKI